MKIDKGQNIRANAFFLSVLLIVVVTGTAFYSSLSNGFTNWDDDKYVTNNETIKNLNWFNIKKMFTSSVGAYYGPLFVLSYALEYHFFHTDAFFYHLDNLILHIIASLLVFWLVLILSRRVSVALITALLFGIHPLHSESVAWIAERKDTLSTPFYLLSIILYLKAKRGKYPLFFSLSFLCAIISSFVKPMAVSLPFILIICDVFEKRNINARAIIEKVPFFILSVIFSVVTIHFQSTAIPTKQVGKVLENVLISCKATVMYLYKTVLPIKLSAFYPYPEDAPVSDLSYWLSAAAVVALVILAVYSLKKTRIVFFSLFFFFISIGPVIGIVPIGSHFIAERYMYIPSIGLFLLFANFWQWLYTRAPSALNPKRIALVAAISLIMVAFGVLTYQRNKVWKTSKTLWEDVLAQFPGKTPAYHNLGTFYHQTKEYEKAERYLLQGAYKRNSRDAYFALGLLYIDWERPKDAIRAFQAAIDLDGDFTHAYAYLGQAYYRNNQKEEAIRTCRKAMEIDPDYPAAYFILGDIYGKEGQYEKSIELFAKAHHLDPTNLDYLTNLGKAYGEEAQYGKAAEYFRQALRLRPHDLEIILSLGLCYHTNKDYDLAIEIYKKALEFKSDFPELYAKIGVVYADKKDFEPARRYLEKGFSMKPELSEVEYYRRAYEKLPDEGGYR